MTFGLFECGKTEENLKKYRNRWWWNVFMVMNLKLSSSHHNGNPFPYSDQEKHAKCAAKPKRCWLFSSIIRVLCTKRHSTTLDYSLNTVFQKWYSIPTHKIWHLVTFLHSLNSGDSKNWV